MKRAYTRALIGLATASIAISLMPLAALHSWILDLFTHFRVQLLVGQLLLVPLLLANRNRLFAALLVVCALVSGYTIRDYLLPAGMPATGPPRLEVLSVNVLGRNSEFAGLIDTIESSAPDLVLVQEYRSHGAQALAALSHAYPHRLEIPREDNFGIALFSRYPLFAAREFDLLGASAIDARVSVDGITLRMLGVHLSTPVTASMSALRQAQLDELAALVGGMDEPLVLAGDFNLTPYSPYFGKFLEQTGLRAAVAGNGPSITWPTFFPILGIPIDHVFVSSSLQVVGYERHPEFGSDHYPINVALR